MVACRCKVTLRQSRPPIWRRVDLPADATLFDVHRILQVAMGWMDVHLHQFEHAGTTYALPNAEIENGAEDERRVAIGQLLRRPKQRLTYEYDFGDSWMHDIVLEAVLDTPTVAARVVGGARACPPEDVGGVAGYARFLEILAHPAHPEHRQMVEWIGGSFDPHAFDADSVNAALMSLGLRHVRSTLTRQRRGSPARPKATSQSTDRSLARRLRKGQPLDRQQQVFNRLIAKMERLRTAFEQEKRRLDEALVYQIAHVQPRVDRVVAARVDLVRALQPFLSDRRLKRAEAQELRTLLAEQLDDVIEHGGELDGDLRTLFEALHGASMAEIEEAGMNEARSAMEGLFADVGLDVDLSGFRADMSEDEVAARMAEMMADVERQVCDDAPQAAGARRRSKREIERHERARQDEAMREANATALYRRLAKVLHPDLEPDPDIRARKNVLMQQLTAAHAARDMYTLLRLELDWLHREEGDGARLTGDTLAAYAQLLKEQIAGLEMEIEMLPYAPKYLPIVRIGRSGVEMLVNGAAEVRWLDDLLESLSDSLAHLRTAGALENVRGAIQLHRRVRRLRS